MPEIPLPAVRQDIFSYGFDKSFSRPRVTVPGIISRDIPTEYEYPESKIVFDPDGGHDHDGANSRRVSAWQTLPVCVYASADSPTFTFTISGDVTTYLSVGMKVKLTQTTVKYFIITALSYSSPNTTVTVYGGTDYTLTSDSILSPSFSYQKSPFGFPLDPLKWTVSVRDTTNRKQLTPTAGTWYNLGGVTIVIPIGSWSVEYFVLMDHIKSSLNETSMSATLSDAATTQGDQDMTSKGYAFFNGATSASNEGMFHGTARKHMILSTKATRYMNAMTTLASSASISFDNDTYPNNIRATCAYL